MGMMEGSPTTIAPLLLRNLVTSIFIFADKSLINLSEKYKLLEFIRDVLITCFLLFLRLLPSFSFPASIISQNYITLNSKSHKNDNYLSVVSATNGGDSGIARALSQLLSIVNDIPVSSRKYEVVRSLAEKIIEENHKEGIEALHDVNRRVLSAAFSRALSQLEAATIEQERGRADDVGSGIGPVENRLGRVLKVAKSFGDLAWRRGWKNRRLGSSAEKLAAEVLWLAQKLTACGCGEEAILKWAAASNLGRLALSAEPRLQGSLVKFSAFLFKEAKDTDQKETEESKREEHRQTKLKMLTSWLPLLCKANNGIDIPVLSVGERAELERILEETIETLEHEIEQEQVLSLWLHHFTHSPSSDWPNLHACYTRWCNASRKLFL
ncbi:1,8-cineole synthase [Quillaja saponaria]|uniref:1,8-cineole synthase n=1 Tax=Quillaja saponaria TaxID=32244 RepID=A0AAD7M3V6_QUISA|nr:1,8-cineole synthase [Quillaja saponaria]